MGPVPSRRIVIWITVGVLLAGTAALLWFLLPEASGRAAIRIGVIQSLTGPDAPDEKPRLAGFQLAVAELNRSGGVVGRRLEIVLRDGESDPAAHAREAERLVRDERVAVIIAGGRAACAARVRAVAEEHRSLFLDLTPGDATEPPSRTLSLGPSPVARMAPALAWAFERGVSSIFLIGGSDPPAEALRAAARRTAAAHGVTVAGDLQLAPGADPAPAARSAAQSGASLVLNAMDPAATPGMLAALRASGLDREKTFVLSTSLEEEASGNRASPGTGDLAVWSWFTAVGGEEARRFIRDLRREAGGEAAVNESVETAYLAVKLWAEAAARAESAAPDAVLPLISTEHALMPEGTVVVDPETRLLWRPIRLGRGRHDGGFDVVWDSDAPVRSTAAPFGLTAEAWGRVVRREGATAPAQGGAR